MILKALYNYSSRLVTIFVTLSLSLITTPLLIKYLGENNFGVFHLALDYLGYLALLEFGYSFSVVPGLSKLNAEGKQTEMLRLSRSLFGVLLRIAFVQFSIALLFSFFAHYLIKVPPEEMSALRTMFQFLAFTFFLKLIIPIQNNLLVEQRQYVFQNAGTLKFILFSLLALFLASKGYGLVGQGIAYLSGELAYGLIMILVRRRLFFDIIGDKESWKWSTNFLKDHQRTSVSSFVSDLNGRLSIASDKIILSFFFAPSKVAFFYVLYRIPQVLYQIILNIGSSVWASLGEIYHKESQEKFNSVLLETTHLISSFSVALFVPLIFLNSSFVRLWMSGLYEIEWYMTLVVCLNLFLLAITTFWSFCPSITGHIHRIPRIATINSILNIGSSIFLTWKVGVLGPLLGTIFGIVAYGMWGFVFLFREVYEISPFKLITSSLLPLLKGIGLSFILWKISQSLSASSWSDFLVSSILFYSLSVLFFWFVLLSRSQRKNWRTRLKRLKARGTGHE